MVSPNNSDIIELGVAFRTEGDGAKTIRNLKKEYQSLEGAVKRANRATDAEAKAVNDVEKALAKVARQSALSDLARQAANAGAQTDILERALRDVGASESEVRRVTSAYDTLSASIQKASDASRSGFDAEGFNTSARRRVGAVGDVDTAAQTLGGGLQAAGFEAGGGVVRAAGEIAAVTEGVVQLAAAAPAAVAALGPLAIAIAGIGTAAIIAGKQINDVNKALAQTIDNQLQRNLDRQTLSTEEAAAKLEALQNELDAVNQTLFETQSAAVNATQSGNALQRSIAATAATFGASATKTAEFRKQQGSLQQQIASLTADLENESFAANDAADSTQAAADALTALNEAAQTRIDGINEEVSINDEIRRASRQFSQEQLDVRLEEIDIQKRAAAERLDALLKEDQAIPAVAEATANAVDEFNRLRETEARLIEEVMPLVQQREREAAAAGLLANAIAAGRDKIEQASEEIQRSLERRASEQQRLAETAANAVIKAEDEIVQIRERSAQRVEQIQSRLQETLRSAEQDRDTGLADAEREASEARAEAQRDANTAIIELEEDLARRRQRIEREATRSLAQAAGDRNAVAAFEARERRDNELADLQEEGDTRRAEINRQYAEQTADIQRDLQRQRAEINLQYQQQIQDAQRSAQAQIQLEQQKAQQEISIKQRQIQAELNALQTLDSAAQQFAQNMISAANSLRAAGQQRSSIFGSTSSSNTSARITRPRTSSSSGSSGGSLLTRTLSGGRNLLSGILSADSGAIVERPGLLRVAAGEAVLRPRQLQAMGAGGGGAPNINMGGITINGAGMSRSQIKRETMRVVDRRIEETLDMAGIED